MELVEELYLTNRGFVTDDYDACLDYIDRNELPLERHEYESGTEIWDSWIVPDRWTVHEAYVERDGERIIDYEDHPLHLISYSDSFQGTVSRETLREHVYTHGSMEDAIPWHFRLNYRPWERDWGFCASQSLVDSLPPGEYDVVVDTSLEPGSMQVAEHHLDGERDETVVLLAHLDHTGMANDDLAGVAVGCELMRRLATRESLTYSYKFLVVQEILGSAAYLSTHREEAADFEYGIFLETPGNDNRLLLQRSFTGETRLDAIAEHRLAAHDPEGEVAPFRDQIGNDELVFEGPGFEVPTISVSRYPYPEYHTHFDDPSILSESRLESYTAYVESIIEVLETDFVPERTFDGVPSLAHPKYDLYLEPDQVLASDTASPSDADKASFRNRLLRYLDGSYSAFDIAAEFDLDYEWVRDHLREYESKGLVSTRPHRDREG